ncbi:MAG: hypothetical protein K0S65_5844, partial [Labilithrix sp.]|nr:hypothetical protein [Labilithrix sp.]
MVDAATLLFAEHQRATTLGTLLRRFVVGFLLAFIGVTTRARADHVEYRDVAVASGLRFPASFDTPSHVETQHIVLTCREERGAPVCDFTASYRVANRATEKEDVAGAFYGRRVRNLQIATDGSRSTTTLLPPDMVSIEEQVHELLCGNLLSLVFTAAPAAECALHHAQRMALWTHGAFAAGLAPGETQSLIVTGTLEPGLSHTRGESWMPSRHPLIGQLSVATYYVDFWLDSVRSETEFEVRLPDGWGVSVRSPTRAAEGRPAHQRLEAEAWPLSREGELHVVRRKFAPDALPEAVSVVIERSPSFLRRGGPFIGFGASLGGTEGFRMRMGYELALGTDHLT